MNTPRVRIVEAEAFERDVTLRQPFRFGVVTLREAPQAFLRVCVKDPASGREAWGHAAELMVPKWFDKRPELSQEDNIDQLRRSLQSAVTLSLAHGQAACAADLAWRLDREQQDALPHENGLVQGFGPALMACAVLDALCHLEQCSFYAAMRHNRVGLGAAHLPADLRGVDIDAFLASLAPRKQIALRHTVGLADPLTPADIEQRLDDGLPECLSEVITRYRPRYFKLKLGGEHAGDLARLMAITAQLEHLPDYRVTLDGNEQYASPEAFGELLDRLEDEPRLAGLRRALLFVEQPIHRDRALQAPLGELGRRVPLLIDESDSHLDSFLQARECGYRGVSSKACKGLYRAVINRARLDHWQGGDYFMSAEDLTTQAGLAVQQDLALVALLGLQHVERNGHHYVRGMTGASTAEMDAFAAAHPTLYRRDKQGLFVHIDDGQIALDSLAGLGFASGAVPDTAAMRPLT
ncbi:enolase-like domain-containing protein [Halomonas salipaludis]|uniref:Mandelate racemase n=1 Tax=Halomonas salipaludis TaxID=2032625 RepID=A0A2A2F0C9_9GAMM|nr:mandelate racemase [Halomonas salipaludis]PAU78013.1 mandelate racemase [Halomonas salipaludis]